MKYSRQTAQGSVMVGVIADTHGVLTDQAVRTLQGVDHIIHAGDVDRVEVLEQLAKLAPVSAVRGNMDNGKGLAALPTTQVTQLGDMYVYTIHDLAHLDLDPAAAGFRVVVYGHYHRPEMRERNGVIFLNPGSASFPRMGAKKSLAFLRIRAGEVEAFHQILE